jgi:hypothetical protein
MALPGKSDKHRNNKGIIMTAPAQEWTTSSQVSYVLGDNAPAADDANGQALLDNSIVVASELLYALSGRQFSGSISVTNVRPTSRPEQIPDHMWNSRIINGGWGFGYNPDWLWSVCHGCDYRGCNGSYIIGLGRSPIVSVEEVMIDGAVLDPADYRVDDAKWLVRQDCSGWPTCQDLSRTTDQLCTFAVSFTFGQDPPESGQAAATLLASEFYKAQTPALAGQCKLPSRVSSISRQGVSIAVLDPMTFISQGFTGLYMVDVFIRAFNPNKQIRKPMVFSPDMVNLGRRQTWPAS